MKVGVVLGTVGGSAGDIRGGAGFPCSLPSPPPPLTGCCLLADLGKILPPHRSPPTHPWGQGCISTLPPAWHHPHTPGKGKVRWANSAESVSMFHLQGPGWVQKAPRRLQEGSKLAPSRPKDGPKATSNGTLLKVSHQAVFLGVHLVQDGPQDGPCWPQEGSKLVSSRPKDGPKATSNGTLLCC